MIKEVNWSKNKDLKSEDCAVFAEIAGRFKSDVYIIKTNKKVNAKSVMGLISLNIKAGDAIYLSVFGIDEEEAFNKLTSLF